MALFLLTLLRVSGNYRLLSGLEGLLNGTFAYYLLLGHLRVGGGGLAAPITTAGGCAATSFIESPARRARMFLACESEDHC